MHKQAHLKSGPTSHQPLALATSPSWATQAVASLDETLVDHAHCEKKAASQALSLIAQYGSACAWLIDPLIGLAQEELRHFRQVHRLIRQRQGALGTDPGDPYVKQLLKLARHSEPERLVDRLLISALVEARSAERFILLADALDKNHPLKDFYTRLAQCESGHHRLYVRLAQKALDKHKVAERLAALSREESAIVAALPLMPRIH